MHPTKPTATFLFFGFLGSALALGQTVPIRDCSVYMDEHFPLRTVRDSAKKFQTAKDNLDTDLLECDAKVLDLASECPKLTDRRQENFLNQRVSLLLERTAEICQKAEREIKEFNTTYASFSKFLTDYEGDAQCLGTIRFIKKINEIRQKNLSIRHLKTVSLCGKPA